MAGGKNIYSPEARQPQRFEFKAGTNGFQWKGHMLEGDPSSIPANRPRLLVNARLSNGVIRPRAGTADYSSGTDTISGCVIALSETDTNVRMYYTIQGCGAFLGSTLLSINQDEFTETRTIGSYFGFNTFLRIAEYGGSVYLGCYGTVRKFADNIDSPTSTGFTVKDTLVKDFTGTAATKNIISMLQSYEGNLYIGISNTTSGACAIWKYDGVTMALDLTPAAFAFPYTSCLWREFMVVSGGFNSIRYRNSTGTWTTVAPGAGTIDVAAGDNKMVSYKDKVYMSSTGGGVQSIWAYDGTTLANVRTMPAGRLIGSLAVFNGYLYYSWNTSPAATAGIGRFDGTTWIDTHKNMTTQFSNVRYIDGFATFREQLYAGINEKQVISSDGYNVSGTWTGTNPTTAFADTASNFVVI